MGVWTANAVVGGAVLLTGISLLLATVGFVSYVRLRHGRLLWIGLAFVGFTAQGAALAWWAYQRRLEIASGGDFEVVALTALDLLIVACLYLAVLKR